MKGIVLALNLVAAASANIIFNHVPLSCDLYNDKMYNGCLRGQVCADNNTCVPMPEQPEFSFTHGRSLTIPRELLGRATYSTDGYCGSAHNNTICDPKSTVYTGGCCSQYGYCGNTAGHCGTGCQSGCTTTSSSSASSPTSTSTAPRSDGQCGSAFGGATCDPNGAYGGCCSQYGYCGKTDGHCLKSNGCQNGCTSPASSSSSSSSIKPSTSSTTIRASSTTASSSQASQTTAPRSDGMCGSGYNMATCDPNGAYGGCCSQYGYCGKTDGHCLVSNGCQLGCTAPMSSSVTKSSSSAVTSSSKASSTSSVGEPKITAVSSTMPPGATATAKVTTDGTCGSSNNGTVCGNWPNGNCCSMYGFCGKTTAHCGAGCQSGNCTTAPVATAPGARPAPNAPLPGNFTVIGSSGVPAMHAALMPNGRVMFLDKLENYTQLTLPNGHYAMSSEYNPADNTVVPLAYKTNAFCSGGCFLPDGRVVSLGGNAPLTFIDPTIGDGFNAIRYLGRSSTDASQNGKDWSEPGNKLASARWYASAQTMPDGTIFVASGSLNGLDPTVLANNNPTYEILSSTAVSQNKNIPLEILVKNQPYYMYPFIHLLSDGSLFIFVSKASERFSVSTNKTLQTYPDLPGDYRTYPNTGGSVLLPLSSATNWAPDIIICGGGAYQDITSPTDPSCGRIQPLSTSPSWEMDSMPEGRGMVEGTLLPDGTVVWLNGGSKGAQGFGLMNTPALEGLLYDPSKTLGSRWSTLASSTIPRLYHSVALLLLDGTLLVTGSNPVQMPVLQASAENPYITEFRVERYTPPYLQGANANLRPTNMKLSATTLSPAQSFTVTFNAPANNKKVSVVLYHGGFVTHSVHMGHRMMVCDTKGFVAGSTTQTVTVTAPPNHNVCPPGPYVVYVLVDGIPAVGQFISMM